MPSDLPLTQTGNKPQEDPHWWQSKSDPGLWYANVWMRDDEVDMYVKRTGHRWGWYIEKDGERIAGSFATRHATCYLAQLYAESYLYDQRQGYTYVKE